MLLISGRMTSPPHGSFWPIHFRTLWICVLLLHVKSTGATIQQCTQQMVFNSSSPDLSVQSSALGQYASGYVVYMVPVALCELTLTYGQVASIYLNQTDILQTYRELPRALLCVGATVTESRLPLQMCQVVSTLPPLMNSTDVFTISTFTSPASMLGQPFLGFYMNMVSGDTAQVQIMQGCYDRGGVCSGVTHVDISTLPSPPSPSSSANPAASSNPTAPRSSASPTPSFSHGVVLVYAALIAAACF